MRRPAVLLLMVLVCLPATAFGRKRVQHDDLLLIVTPTARAIASAHPHVNVIVRFGTLSTGIPADPATFSARLGRLDVTSQFTPIVDNGRTVGMRAELRPDQLRTGRGRRNRLKMSVDAMATDGGTKKNGRPRRDKDKVRFRAEEMPNQPPVAIAFTSARLLLPNNPISFDSSESHDPDGDVITYRWEFGDGDSSTEQTVTHLFEETGADATVQLIVNDGQNDGATSVLLRTCPQPENADPGFLEVSSDQQLEFGPVPTGTTVTRTFTVKNTDEPGTTTIGACVGIASRSGAFTITPEEFMLDGGESREVTVSFAPAAEGHTDATLTVVGSARERPIVTFLAHGYGGAGTGPSGPTLAPQPFFYSDIVPDLFGLGIYHVRPDGTETLVDNGVNTCEVPQFGLGTGDVCVENRDCASNGGSCATAGTCLGGLNAGNACSLPQDCPEGFCPAYTLFDPVQMCGDGEGGLYVLSDEGTYTDPNFETGTELSISVLGLQVGEDGSTSDRKILDRVATETTQMACDGFPGGGGGRIYLSEFQEIDLGNSCFRSEKERLITLRKNDGTRQVVMGRIDAAAGIPECGDDGDIDPVLHLETSADGADTFVSFETNGLWRIRPTPLQFLTGDDNFLNEELFRLHPDGDLLYTTTTNGPTSSVVNLYKISADQVAGGPVPLDALTPCAVYQVPNNGYISDDGSEELRGSSAVIAFDAAPISSGSRDATVLVNFASGASNLHPAHLSTDLAIRGTIAFSSPAGSSTCEVLGLTNLRIFELMTF